MLDKGDLDAAVAAGLIDQRLRAELDAFAAARRKHAPRPQFEPIHALYYAGALIVMSAMTLFATTAFEALGGWGLFGFALAYGAGFLALGDRLWRSDLRIPGGLLVAAAVAMTPLAIYGVQDALNLWAADKPGAYRDYAPLINGSWIYMDLGAMVASGLAARRYPLPFIVLIGAVAAWFLSMDLAAVLVHRSVADWAHDWELRRTVSELFGLAMIACAWTLDLRTRGDFGFWLHLFGAMTLWGAITASDGGGEMAKALYCGFNVLFVALGLFLNRRVYAVFGAIGVSIYLGYLAADRFKDTLSFTFALTAIGLAMVFAGVALERRRAALTAFFEATLPRPIKALRPRRG